MPKLPPRTKSPQSSTLAVSSAAFTDTSNTTSKEPTLVQQLLHAVKTLVSVKSKPEQIFWDNTSCQLIIRLLDAGKDASLFSALDKLWEQNPEAYECLADLIEQCVQSANSEDGMVNLLITIPVLVWSRNPLPSGKTDAKAINSLTQALKKHWLAENTEVFIGNTLYTPDTLPDGFCATRKLARKHFDHAATAKSLPFKRDPKLKDDNPFLADCRFWIGVVRAPAGQPLFQAQLNLTGEVDLTTQETLWQTLAAEAVSPYFIGCAYEIMPPETYYEASRSAELAIRGFSLQASILMVMTTLDIEAEQLRVVIAACHSNQFEEYRISILLKSENTVLQGISWPLLGREESQEDLLAEIYAHLKALGIQRIRLIEENLAMEYCDDCDAPLFPDPNAEMVHLGDFDEEDDGNKSRTLH